MDYTVTLTEAETKAMEYVAADVQDWIDNAATNRARIASLITTKQSRQPTSQIWFLPLMKKVWSRQQQKETKKHHQHSLVDNHTEFING